MADRQAIPVWERVRVWAGERHEDQASWLTSLLLHLAILFLLWQTLLPAGQTRDLPDALIGGLEPGAGLNGPDGAFENVLPRAGDPRVDEKIDRPEAVPGAQHVGPPELPIAGFGDLPRGPEIDSDAGPEPEAAIPVVPQGRGKAGRASLRKKAGGGKELGANLAGILEGRGEAARAKLVKAGGGTKKSERAVELGLQWLARHQKPDGSWSFQHGPDDPGLLDCPTGATGLALLALLGAGHTHQQGVYRSQVNGGLKYLVDNMELTERGAWLRGTGQATMYVQAICTIVLCEAYSMTKDAELRRPAQLAITFIANAQDPESGGWRYRIPQAGDTSVVGWQLMALQSARVAELEVPTRVIPRVTRFLKSVEADGGALYAYNRPGTERPSMTAVGLLCRMYLGRDPTHKGMIRGINRLAEWGPSPHDMYYNYYATQVMHHWGDARWEQWNSVMRDLLVNSQEQEGDAAGSWPTDASHGSRMGGRLYTTCLSILTLEVYYRYLSLYRRPAAADDS